MKLIKFKSISSLKKFLSSYYYYILFIEFILNYNVIIIYRKELNANIKLNPISLKSI